LLSDKPARCSHGNQLRDYLYVQDVAHAFVVLLESDIRGPVNIASGYPVSLKEIVHKIAAKLNREDLVQMGALPVAADEPDLLVGDVSRLSNEAAWRPEYDLDDGLEKTISWWRTRLSAGRFE
jgi:nucleoside-diphosphate-sugar epimerase